MFIAGKSLKAIDFAGLGLAPRNEAAKSCRQAELRGQAMSQTTLGKASCRYACTRPIRGMP